MHASDRRIARGHPARRARRRCRIRRRPRPRSTDAAAIGGIAGSVDAGERAWPEVHAQIARDRPERARVVRAVERVSAVEIAAFGMEPERVDARRPVGIESRRARPRGGAARRRGAHRARERSGRCRSAAHRRASARRRAFRRDRAAVGRPGDVHRQLRAQPPPDQAFRGSRRRCRRKTRAAERARRRFVIDDRRRASRRTAARGRRRAAAAVARRSADCRSALHQHAEVDAARDRLAAREREGAGAARRDCRVP